MEVKSYAKLLLEVEQTEGLSLAGVIRNCTTNLRSGYSGCLFGRSENLWYRLERAQVVL